MGRKSLLPFGLRRRRAAASSPLLNNVPHCLRRGSSHRARRRSQRGSRDFYHELFGRAAEIAPSAHGMKRPA